MTRARVAGSCRLNYWLRLEAHTNFELAGPIALLGAHDHRTREFIHPSNPMAFAQNFNVYLNFTLALAAGDGALGSIGFAIALLEVEEDQVVVLLR